MLKHWAMILIYFVKNDEKLLRTFVLFAFSIFLSVFQVKAAYFDRVNLSTNGFYKWVPWVSHWFSKFDDK